MAYEQKQNSGSLFKNENHPNATGSALISGVEYWVSAWTKRDKNDKPWQSLSFKPKDAAKSASPAKSKPAQNDDFDDSLPF